MDKVELCEATKLDDVDASKIQTSDKFKKMVLCRYDLNRFSLILNIYVHMYVWRVHISYFNLFRGISCIYNEMAVR